MRTFPLTLLLIGLAASSGLAQSRSFCGEFRVAVPSEWSPSGDTTGYPIQLVHQDGDAEFLIFRTELAKDEVVSSRAELKIAVQRIVDSVILTLPQAKLISNTGYDEKERVQFALEFISSAAGDNMPMRHRLTGYIYRTLDGRQILFTLWGRGILARFQDKLPQVLAMQNSFEFTGPHDATVFGTSSGKWFMVILLSLIVIALAGYSHSRRRAVQDMAEDDELWTCSCGSRNAAQLGACRSCGKLKRAKIGIS
jgi:hypothetical protein